MKKRIKKIILLSAAAAIFLCSFSFIAICFSAPATLRSFRVILGLSAVFDILIYILFIPFAEKISEATVRPILSIDLNKETESTYEELKPFLKRIRTQNKESELSLQIRREFSANVSHELKTPLTSILGYSQILTNKLAQPDDIVSISSKIENESTRLLNIINDIIELSHLEEEGTVSQREDIDLFQTAKEVAAELAPHARERKISIETLGVETIVSGNRTQIHELVYNLVDNAVKYNRDFGSVRITACNSSISIADTGIGIPAEYRDRIFERFFRVDKSRSKKVNGTGLGLSIVKHIAIMHNAKISVESEPGKGTEITVDFNLAPQPPCYV